MAQFTVQEKEEVLLTLKRINDDNKDIKHILHGRKDSPEPSGLIHMVSSNTKFRRWITTWLWLLMVITTGLVVERLFALIGG